MARLPGAQHTPVYTGHEMYVGLLESMISGSGRLATPPLSQCGIRTVDMGLWSTGPSIHICRTRPYGSHVRILEF